MDQSGSIEPSGIPMQGTVASGFEEVAEAFARAVAMSPRGGAALHVRQDSRVVADLWGGFADEGREWSADTLTVLASCTKAVVAILMGELVREGRLQLDAPVAQYWPEFAAKGKGAITVREALAHRAGLPWVRQDLVKSDLVDPLAMAAILADEEPMFAPGTTHLYHALTYGWIAGEIVRRVTGSRSASYFATHYRPARRGPLDRRAGRGPGSVARLHAVEGLPDAVTGPLSEGSYLQRERYRGITLGGAFPVEFATADGGGMNDPDIQRAQIAGAGAFSPRITPRGGRPLRSASGASQWVMASIGGSGASANGDWPSPRLKDAAKRGATPGLAR